MRPLASAALVAGCVLALAACNDNSAAPDEATATVILQFDAVVDGAPLVLDTGRYTNAAGNSYTVSNLEYVVSAFTLEEEVALRHDDLPGFHADVQHYRTEADAATRTLTFADVPAGDYSGLHFRFGLEGAENVAGTFPALDAVNLAWPAPMGGGYHYMRHEGAYTPTGGGTANFTTHTGPSMGQDFSFEVDLVLETGGTLRHGFALAAGDTAILRLEMNVNAWYATPNEYDFNDHGAIMGDPSAQAKLQANGAHAWSLGSVTIE